MRRRATSGAGSRPNFSRSVPDVLPATRVGDSHVMPATRPSLGGPRPAHKMQIALILLFARSVVKRYLLDRSEDSRQDETIEIQLRDTSRGRSHGKWRPRSPEPDRGQHGGEMISELAAQRP